MPLGAHRLNSLALPSIAEEPVITSRIPLTISAFDNAQVSTAQSKFGGASLYLDGATDYIQAEFSETLGVGTGDFTFELWYYTSNNNQNGILYNNRISAASTPPGNGNFLRILNGNLEWSPDPTTIVYSVTAPAVDTWHHVAVTRESGDLNIWVDGTSVINITSTHDFSGSRPLSIGEFENGVGAADFIGYVDEFRASNIARYSSSFTPPTAPFTNDSNTLLLIHMDGTNGSTYFEDDTGVRSPLGVSAINNSQIDTAISKFGGASGLFDGVDDYLQVYGDNSFWHVAVGEPRTFECWVYSDSIADSIDVIMSQRTTGGGTTGWRWEISSDGGTAGELRLILWDVSASADVVYSSNAITQTTWHHVAYVWDGVDNHSLYIDGVRGLSHTASDTGSADVPLRIGNEFDSTGGRGWDGNIDEVRISNIARYSGASFTAPTEPFINDENTLLLLHMDGSDGSTDFVDDNS